MIRHIYIVNSSRHGGTPLMAFSDVNEAREFASRVLVDSYSYHDAGELIKEVQWSEGSAVDEMLKILERKLERDGIEITDVEFENEVE